MFGSDWPVSTLATTYQAWLATVFEAADEPTPCELAGVMGGNAVRVYGLKKPHRKGERMLVAEYAGNSEFSVTERPATDPGPGQVQIAVAYVGICGTDLHVKHGHMDGSVSIPGPIGHEMSGVIAAVGKGVAGLDVGDAVTVMPLQWCGRCRACLAGNRHVCQKLVFVGIDSAGAMQQLWTVDQSIVVRLPEEVQLDVGALAEPLAVAVHDVSRGRVVAGETVLVVGGGPIGLLIALVARSREADVLISEPNAFRRALADRFGLRTVDPTSADVAQVVETWTDGAGVDATLEVSGAPQGLMAAIHALRFAAALSWWQSTASPCPPICSASSGGSSS